MAKDYSVSIDFEKDFVYPLLDVFAESTVLSRAILCGSSKRTKFLLERGCDPNTCIGTAQVRPLMIACFIKNILRRYTIFKTLLEFGADPCLTDVNGRTCVMYACALSLEKEVYILIQGCDYDLSVADLHGDTALHICAKAGDVEVLKILLCGMQRYRLSVSVYNNAHFTPLSLAIINGHYHCAKLLYEAGGLPQYSRSDFEGILLSLRNTSRKNSQVYPISKESFDSRVLFRSRRHHPRHLLTRRASTAMEKEKESPNILRSNSEGAINSCSLPSIVMATHNSLTDVSQKIPSRNFSEIPRKPTKDSAVVQPLTSAECIDTILNSSLYKSVISASYCKPLENVNETDFNWSAVAQKYKDIAKCEAEAVPKRVLIQHVSSVSFQLKRTPSSTKSSLSRQDSHSSTYSVSLKHAASSPYFWDPPT